MNVRVVGVKYYFVIVTDVDVAVVVVVKITNNICCYFDFLIKVFNSS